MSFIVLLVASGSKPKTLEKQKTTDERTLMAVLMRILPQPGEVYGLYPEGYSERFPSLIFLSDGVDRSGPQELVRGKVYQVIGDNPARAQAAFMMMEDIAEAITLDKFNELFNTTQLKIETAASGVAG